LDKLDKTVPANPEAEEAVLGSLLIDPDAVLKVASFLEDDDFYRERNGWIYRAILDLHERREPADFVTLCDELERRNVLQEVGGAAYITQLINNVPSAAYVEHYGHIVERTATLRRLIDAAGQIAALAYEEAQDVDEVVDRAEQIVFNVAEKRIRRDLAPVRQVMHEVVDRIDYLHRHQGQILGVPSGFTQLDRLLGGFQKSDLIILAARPAVGKTSLSLNFALNAARRFRKVVAYFSLEMSSEQLVQRLPVNRDGD
jgi:replicative DNA helicase